MQKKDITILTTWDNEIIELPISFGDWINAKTSAKMNWDDWILIKNRTRYLKFATLKDEVWKTKYLELPQSEKKKIQYSDQQLEEMRIKKEKFIKKCLEISENSRRKNFIDDRNLILQNLAKREKYWWMTTTLEMIEQLNQFRKQEILNSNKNLW